MFAALLDIAPNRNVASKAQCLIRLTLAEIPEGKLRAAFLGFLVSEDSRRNRRPELSMKAFEVNLISGIDLRLQRKFSACGDFHKRTVRVKVGKLTACMLLILYL